MAGVKAPSCPLGGVHGAGSGLRPHPGRLLAVLTPGPGPRSHHINHRPGQDRVRGQGWGGQGPWGLQTEWLPVTPGSRAGRSGRCKAARGGPGSGLPANTRATARRRPQRVARSRRRTSQPWAFVAAQTPGRSALCGPSNLTDAPRGHKPPSAEAAVDTAAPKLLSFWSAVSLPSCGSSGK